MCRASGGALCVGVRQGAHAGHVRWGAKTRHRACQARQDDSARSVFVAGDVQGCAGWTTGDVQGCAGWTTGDVDRSSWLGDGPCAQWQGAKNRWHHAHPFLPSSCAARWPDCICQPTHALAVHTHCHCRRTRPTAPPCQLPLISTCNKNSQHISMYLRKDMFKARKASKRTGPTVRSPCVPPGAPV